MNIAIIPARGGSKRIPNKNIRNFYGRPIISYVIQAAQQSGVFSEIMVSTDDPQIAKISVEHGACVPFLRSKTRSDDFTPITPVIREVLSEYRRQGREFTQACCLLATAALVSPYRLRQAAHLLAERSDAEGLISVVRTAQPVSKALCIDGDRVRFMYEHQALARSQDLPETYFDAAQMYWVKPSVLLACTASTMSGLMRLPLVLSEFETQDINSPEDWQIAEWKHQFLQLHPEIIGRDVA